MKGRRIATLLLGAALGLFLFANERKWLGRGRGPFLIYENRRFDHMHAHWLGLMLSGIVVAVVVFGCYELLAASLNKLKPRQIESSGE